MLRLRHGRLHLPRRCGLDLGLRLDRGLPGRRLHGLRGQRRCAPDGWRIRHRWRHRPWAPQGPLREPGGVRASQHAPGGAGHSFPLVRLVRLQLRLHSGNERRGHGRDGSSGGHEHHPFRGDWRNHGLRRHLHHDEVVRRQRHVQRHPGGTGVHHRGLRQHGLRLGHLHRHARILHLCGQLEAPEEAEDRRPRGRQLGARCLRHLGCPRLRPLRLGQGPGPGPRLERLQLHDQRGRHLPDRHLGVVLRHAARHVHRDLPLVRWPLGPHLLRPDEDRQAAHQRGG
mmetsp:Transcript_69415/g.203726  ORF Transcript_69415/g.203726 Transcript_69415/m.203726 type:complete len:284 (+) Transcript_69415:776-1627(+)